MSAAFGIGGGVEGFAVAAGFCCLLSWCCMSGLFVNGTLSAWVAGSAPGAVWAGVEPDAFDGLSAASKLLSACLCCCVLFALDEDTDRW